MGSIRGLPALMAAAGVFLSQPVQAQAEDQKLGKVHFETSCSPEAAAAFDRGMLYQSLILVSRLATRIQQGTDGRPWMRHRLLGDRAEPVVEPASRTAGEKPRRWRSDDREGERDRREN